MTAQSLFGDTPSIEFADNSESKYTMATKIRFGVDGTISGIRYWGTTNPPALTSQGAVYRTDGTLLASQDFGAFVPSNWNTLMLSSPQTVLAGETRVLARGPLDRYAATRFVFSSELVVGDLIGVEGMFIETPGASPVLTFPTSSVTTWYGIDVIFDTGPAIVTLSSIVTGPSVAVHRAGSW